jgi:hypothetical protein
LFLSSSGIIGKSCNAFLRHYRLMNGKHNNDAAGEYFSHVVGC